MYFVVPIPIADSDLVDSSVSEDDPAEWDISTSYDDEDRVISTTTHKVYESVQDANLGNDPTTDVGTWWVEVGATDKYKVIDGKLTDAAPVPTGATGAWWEFDLGGILNSILNSTNPPSSSARLLACFFNLRVKELTLKLYSDDTKTVVVSTTTLDGLQPDDSDGFTYFVGASVGEVNTFGNFSATSYLRLDAEVDAYYDNATGKYQDPGQIGQIVLGFPIRIGQALEGTEIGLRSFSVKEQDDFGNWSIVPRAKSDPVTFQIAVDADKVAATQYKLNRLRDVPVVWYADESLIETHGAITYGFFRDYEIALRREGKVIFELEIEGLT